MEGVSKHHLVAERLDVARLERLDGAARRQRNERGRLHVAVSEAQDAGAGAAVARASADFEHGPEGSVPLGLCCRSTLRAMLARLRLCAARSVARS